MLIASPANYNRYLLQCENVNKYYGQEIKPLSDKDDYIKHLYSLVSEWGNYC